MTVSQGINKVSAIKIQSQLGTPATGAGGTALRRRSNILDLQRATYVNDEIVTHQQSTGVNLGTAASSWNYDALLSPGGAFPLLFGALLRKTFAPVTALTALSLTVAVVGGGVYTVTRAAGDFLAGGLKIGDVVRITAGTFANGVNRDNNLLVLNVTNTVITCIVLNNTVLIAEGPIASCTVSVVGKKSIVPLTGHIDPLFTVEDWYADLSQSELFPDMRPGQADVALPASGNASVRFTGAGLGVRTAGGAQVLTTPTFTDTEVLTAVRGALIVNGAKVGNVTGMTLTIRTQLTPEGPIVGSNFSPDMARGRVEVNGSFTGLFDTVTLRNAFDAETKCSIVVAMATDTGNAADFMTFSMSSVKLTGATPDDGERPITRSYPFVASINGTGGAALANDKTVISIQDSQA
jgi:Phage tail tube protein